MQISICISIKDLTNNCYLDRLKPRLLKGNYRLVLGRNSKILKFFPRKVFLISSKIDNCCNVENKPGLDSNPLKQSPNRMPDKIRPEMDANRCEEAIFLEIKCPKQR